MGPKTGEFKVDRVQEDQARPPERCAVIASIQNTV